VAVVVDDPRRLGQSREEREETRRKECADERINVT
jgi:hypothetical protein